MGLLALDSAQLLVLALFHGERAAERNPKACALGSAPQRAPNAFRLPRAANTLDAAALPVMARQLCARALGIPIV
jgi:hypothetical protein